eukprot:7070840-Pyramimonas_sp.AAC.1
MARRGLFRWPSAPRGQTCSEDSESTLEGYSQEVPQGQVHPRQEGPEAGQAVFLWFTPVHPARPG